jgi:hypothetical protein
MRSPVYPSIHLATTDDEHRRAVCARRQHAAAVARGTLRDRLDSSSDDDLVFIAHHGPDAEVRSVAHDLVRQRCRVRLAASDMDQAEWDAIHQELVARRTSIRAADGRYLAPTLSSDADLLYLLGGAR